jgi:anti-sigma B factor antagonist
MQITREQVSDVTVVTVHADYLDASNSKEFKRDIADTFEPKAKVVLDLARVRFIDSSGCGALLSYLRQLNAAGGDLKLCSVTQPVRALFELVRFHRILDILNTRDEAVKAFQL